jgi:hypothetical protein
MHIEKQHIGDKEQRKMQVRGELHAPVGLLLGKQPRYPLNGMLGGPQNPSGHFGRNRNLFLPPESEPQSLN